MATDDENSAKEWVETESFGSMTAAVRRIREIEGYSVTGLFLEIHIETVHGSDEEALGHFEDKGRRALYVIKRRMN